MVKITAQFKRAKGFSPMVLLAAPTQAEAAEEKKFLKLQAKLVTNAIFGGDEMVVFSGQPMKKEWNMLRREVRKEQKQGLMRTSYTPPDPKRCRISERLFAITVDDMLPFLSYDNVKMLASVSRSMRATFFDRVRVWDLRDPDTMGFCDWDPELLNTMFQDAAHPQILVPGSYLMVTGRGNWSSCDVLYYPEEYDPAWTAHEIEDTWPRGQGRRMALEAVKLCDTGVWDNQTLDRIPRDAELASEYDNWERAMQKTQSVSEANRRNQRKYFAQLSHLSGMVRGLAQHGSYIRQLELSHIPYLDLKLTGVIVEMLPKLKVLTINACELMHLGTLIPLLDYINWIGYRRDEEFIELDFFPKAWFGPAENRESTRILTWGPTSLNTRQAVMCTIITATMKASEMGRDLLTDSSLLYKYLALVPMDFGLISVFIRNLKAYVIELQYSANNRTEADDLRIFNLERQILAALTTGNRRPIQADMMMALMEQRWTCSRCEHVYASPCFEARMASWPEHQRLCYPCRLGEAIEREKFHHWQDEKRTIASSLTNVRSEAKYEAPLKAQMVAPMLKNTFVAVPIEVDDGSQWDSWMTDLGSENLRTLHENKAAWSYAGHLAHTLDAKNRFSKALGMDLDHDYISNRATGGQRDGPKQPVQPFNEHIDRQSWESLYAFNIQTQRVKREIK
ncbi:hypothetical protein ACHAQH_002046 [Verticillium albo-atrum]